MTDLLDEDRMTRMRSTVLGTVEERTRRRGARLRRRLGVGVAAATVLVVGTVGSSVVTANDDAADAVDGMAVSSRAEQDSSAPEAAGGSADTSRTDGYAAEVAPEDVREVVVTGSVSVLVDDPRADAAAIAAWVEGHGGRVDARELYDSDDSPSATLTLRVPADRVTATLDHLESYGDVTDVSVSNDDVTSTARDLDARITALRISIDRLEDILGKARSSADVVAAEQALTDRQAQLEQLVGQRTQVSEQVALATLTVNLSAQERAGSVDPGGFRGGLQDGWNALVDVVNRLVEGAGAALPWLGVLLVLYGGYRLARRVVVRRP